MFVLAQDLVVASIVGACAAYAIWVLLPSAARRALASTALRLPLPAPLATPLHRVAQRASGCGCDGCDKAAVKPLAGATQRVIFHPRPRR